MVAVPVLVVGPDDLLTTSIVVGLRAAGFQTAERNAHREPRARPAVVVVTLETADCARVIADAVRAGLPTIVVGPSDTARAAEAVAAGASAYVPRSAPLEQLVAAVRHLATGGPGMPDEERRTWLETHRVTQERLESRRQRLDTLTDREFEVLRCLERGLKATDIARVDMVSITTVRTHIRSILRKLEVNSQFQAIEFYRQARRH
jgi:DNA-binding NarL/FixJ family response regulator